MESSIAARSYLLQAAADGPSSGAIRPISISPAVTPDSSTSKARRAESSPGAVRWSGPNRVSGLVFSPCWEIRTSSRASVKTGDWNQVHIIARGNMLTHIINGRTMSIFIDDDPTMAAAQGVIALQIEGTGKVSFRNLWLKSL